MCHSNIGKYFQGFKRKNAYILTQAPMPSTVVDFWRMIYDHDSYSIVMLNDMEAFDEVHHFKYLIFLAYMYLIHITNHIV